MDWSTHSVSNQVDELRDVDLLAIYPALQQHLRRLGAAWALPGLHAYGTALGRAETFEQAAQANAAGPVLQRFDARGRRRVSLADGQAGGGGANENRHPASGPKAAAAVAVLRCTGAVVVHAPSPHTQLSPSQFRPAK